jgi:hypothetical protein
MGLLFYSSRYGYDESPELMQIDAGKDHPVAIAPRAGELVPPFKTRQD